MPRYVTPEAITLTIASKIGAFEIRGWKRRQLELLLGWQTEALLRKHLAIYLNRRNQPELTGNFFNLEHEHVLIFADVPRLHTVRVAIWALNPTYKPEPD